MWILENRTVYAAERTWTRDAQGQHLWLIAVRATFDLLPDGTVRLADKQEPPLMAPEFIGEPGQSSLLYETDLVPPKPTTDVLVHGIARSPRAHPLRVFPVQLRIGALSKQIIVHGPRTYVRTSNGLGISAAAPFVQVPLLYEWAYGGTDATDPDPQKHSADARNPVGKGHAASWPALIDTPAFRVEYPHRDPVQAGPAGFGPIASHWSSRVEHGGTYDEAWANTQKPLLPLDYDPRFQLTAPLDQRPQQHLRGAEPVELSGLSHDGVLRFQLPRIYLAFTTFIRGRQYPHRSKLGTVLIETELKRLTLVWHTSLPVRGVDLEYLDKTRIREKRYVR